MSIWSFLLPFFYWIFLLKSFVFGSIAINMDTFTIYGVTKYYFNNLLNGVVPLWDPFVYLGTPFYGIAICNLFNPVTQLVAVLKLVGVNYYDAFIIYLVVYYFLGCIGFYLLAKSLWGDRRIAYAGYLLVLFSGIGVAIFNQMTILELFVPATWFFYFALEFSRHFRRCDFWGLIYSSMVLCISYVPFYFATLLCVFLLGTALFFPKALFEFVQKSGRFLRANIFLSLLGLMAIATALTPLVLYKIMDSSGEIVSPARHCMNTSVEECQTRTLSEEGAMSYEETSRSGGLGERVHASYFFSHLDKLSYGCDHLFFLPVWAYLLVFLTAFVRINRKIALLYFVCTILTLIALANASGLHRVLYDHVFYFKYFRNLFFFEAYIMPVVILIVLGQLKLALDAGVSQRKALAAGVIFLHGTFALFLYHWGNIVVSSWITIGCSAVLATLYVLGAWRNKEWIWKIAILIVILINPAQVFGHYARHAQEFSCPIPREHVTPSFSFLRPAKDEYPACRIFQFAHYENFWNAMTMTDTSGAIGYPTSVTRYVFGLSQQIPEEELMEYIGRKFVVYDKKSAAATIQKESSQFKVTHFDVNNLAVTANFADPIFLVYNDSFTRYWKAYVNGQPVALQKANLAFKGVDVPAGETRVEFRYQPPLGGGIYLFVTAIFCVCFLALVFLQLSEKKLCIA